MSSPLFISTAFHGAILNDHDVLKTEDERYKPISVVRHLIQTFVQDNYAQIKQEIEDLVVAEIERVMNESDAERVILKK